MNETKVPENAAEGQAGIIKINEEKIHGHLDEMVRSTVEETLNGMLEAEAEKLVGAGRYERSEGRQDTRAGHYERNLDTKAGRVRLKMPKLRKLTFGLMKVPLCLFIVSVLLLVAGDIYGDIAFVANSGGNWDLYTADEQGKNRVQLTNTEYDEKDPSWSFDGKSIVYATSDGELNIVNIESKEIRQIAATQLEMAKGSPCFSPDGKKVAFAQFRLPEERDKTDLMLYKLETKSVRRLLDQYGIQMWPTWSPDGERIVYANMHCSAECGSPIQELWIADPRGGWARQLLMTHFFCQQPDWSLGGRRIAFSSNKSGNFDIWILSLDTGTLEMATKDKSLDVSPAWSPEGNRLAFVSTRSGKMEIWIKDLESAKLRRLSPFGEEKVECKDVDW